ncbi:hypothetical protein RF11_16060 [Thelohanellus kitauei]|uniref:Poly(A) RNA polymerase mitochondrial-like central palm domain-containing protein n=1 Tax=Thelohanellus kitauei TaxID=669202 RepID=A0A0C2MVK9_THEKT|nr:hypothetical protein RF11_16060 [Thelohanellus kitauei]
MPVVVTPNHTEPLQKVVERIGLHPDGVAMAVKQIVDKIKSNSKKMKPIWLNQEARKYLQPEIIIGIKKLGSVEQINETISGSFQNTQIVWDQYFKSYYVEIIDPCPRIKRVYLITCESVDLMVWKTFSLISNEFQMFNIHKKFLSVLFEIFKQENAIDSVFSFFINVFVYNYLVRKRVLPKIQLNADVEQITPVIKNFKSRSRKSSKNTDITDFLEYLHNQIEEQSFILEAENAINLISNLHDDKSGSERVDQTNSLAFFRNIDAFVADFSDQRDTIYVSQILADFVSARETDNETTNVDDERNQDQENQNVADASLELQKFIILKQSLISNYLETLPSLSFFDSVKKEIVKLEKCIASKLGKCNLKPYGSFLTGLICLDSEIDLTLLIESSANDIQFLHQISDTLNSDEYESWICKSKGLKLKVHSINSKIIYVIVVNFTSGISQAMVLNSYIHHYPNMKIIFSALRVFFKQEIIESLSKHHISSYCLVILLIHFLQNVKILPILKSKKHCVVPKHSDFLINDQNSKHCFEDADQNPAKYLLEFFSFYSKYHFATSTISIIATENGNGKNTQGSIVILDPVTMTNIVNNMSRKQFLKFQCFLRETSKSLQIKMQTLSVNDPLYVSKLLPNSKSIKCIRHKIKKNERHYKLKQTKQNKQFVELERLKYEEKLRTNNHSISHDSNIHLLPNRASNKSSRKQISDQ